MLIGRVDKDLQEATPRVRQDLALSPFDLFRPIVSPGLATGCRSSGRNVLPLGEHLLDGVRDPSSGHLAGRPPGLGAGMRGSRRAYSSSVRSLG